MSCFNCGQATGPRFCGHCGQEVEPRRGPLFTVVREVLEDWLSLDGRLLRTLAQLAFPGRLTEHYLAGRRVAYLRPLRLYFIASVLLFSSLLSLRAPDAAKVNLYIAGQLVTEAPAVKGRLDLTLFNSDSSLNRWLTGQNGKKIEALRRQSPQELLDALFAGLRRVLPSALILFVPFLALGLKVLFLRRKILFVDHLVFALHIQSALFVVLAVSWVMCRLAGAGLFVSLITYVLAGCGVVFVYMPLALHRIYRQRRLWTVLKSVLLIFIYSQLLKLIFGVAMLLITEGLS